MAGSIGPRCEGWRTRPDLYRVGQTRSRVRKDRVVFTLAYSNSDPLVEPGLAGPSPGCRSVSASRGARPWLRLAVARGCGGDGHGGHHGAESRRAGVGAAAGRVGGSRCLTSAATDIRAIVDDGATDHVGRARARCGGRDTVATTSSVAGPRGGRGCGHPDHRRRSRRGHSTRRAQRSEPPLVPLPAPTRPPQQRPHPPPPRPFPSVRRSYRVQTRLPLC